MSDNKIKEKAVPKMPMAPPQVPVPVSTAHNIRNGDVFEYPSDHVWIKTKIDWACANATDSLEKMVSLANIDGLCCQDPTRIGKFLYNVFDREAEETLVEFKPEYQYIAPKIKEETKENAMSIEIKDVTYVNGTPVNDLSEEQILLIIHTQEGTIERLGQTKVKTKQLTALIKTKEQELENFVTLMNELEVAKT